MTEEPTRDELRFRRQVDAAGWAMMSHVLTLDQGLSDGAFRLYALLLKYARQEGGCWPGVARLAQDLGKDQATVKRRVAELESRGLITRERRYGRSSLTWLEDLEPLYSGLKNEPFEQPFEQRKNAPIEQRKNAPTEEEAEKKKHTASADLTEQERSSFDRLAMVPRMDPMMARKLAKSCPPALVAGWVDHVLRAELDNPAGLVVARLLAGEPAPTDRAAPRGQDGEGDRRRFIAGDYAEDINY